MALKYKYEIGYILKGKRSDITFIDKTITTMKNGKRKSAYIYKCNRCGNIDVINQDAIPRGTGCNTCGGTVVKPGINDVWTTAKDIAEKMLNKEDGHKYGRSSAKKVDFVCPECGSVSKKKISSVYNYGFNCPYCPSKYSIPEKFALAVFKASDLDFIPQYNKSYATWVGSYRYDFYLPEFDTIIEIHGSQHYEECQYNRRTGGLKKTQVNDNNKKALAEKNVANYIVVDCRRTDLEFMRNSFLNNEKLNAIIDFSKIDWKKIFENFNTRDIKEICDMYNNGCGVMELAQSFSMDKETIRKRLVYGNSIGLCSYSVDDDSRRKSNVSLKNKQRCSKKVVCIETGVVYDSCADSDRANNLSLGSTSACASGCRKINSYIMYYI